MKEISQKRLRRVFAVDIIRIACALLIFARHSITMFGITYGSFLDTMIKDSTSIVMTCFFIISGFSVYYSNFQKDLGNIKEKLNFYFKRAIGILRAY